jgi:hypothetical protein
MRRLSMLFAAAVCSTAGPAGAAEDRWSFDFGQGVGEYAIGSFQEGGSHLALSCSEAGDTPSSSISLARAGFVPAKPTVATFVTDKGRATVKLDAGGWVRFKNQAAPEFRNLWRLIGAARTLRIAYGPGAPMILPVAGAADLLGSNVCPRQLAR